MGKKIHWELCKKLKFDFTNKWYMSNPEPVLENETHEIHWDFEIQTDNLISAEGPDLVIVNINKKKREEKELLLNSRLSRPGGPQSKIKRKREKR